MRCLESAKPGRNLEQQMPRTTSLETPSSMGYETATDSSDEEVSTADIKSERSGSKPI